MDFPRGSTGRSNQQCRQPYQQQQSPPKQLHTIPHRMHPPHPPLHLLAASPPPPFRRRPHDRFFVVKSGRCGARTGSVDTGKHCLERIGWGESAYHPGDGGGEGDDQDHVRKYEWIGWEHVGGGARRRRYCLLLPSIDGIGRGTRRYTLIQRITLQKGFGLRTRCYIRRRSIAPPPKMPGKSSHQHIPPSRRCVVFVQSGRGPVFHFFDVLFVVQ
mmetsp:Transcript_2803/g.5201  ORF Transcript_2803/g.5201 Transcript_2803/m.5201 type:complete len:215 (+) Transcript_2803:678-1322(+)